MPTLTVTKNYADGTALTESQLDDIKDSVETFINTTKLDADNLQTDAITTAKITALNVTRPKLEAVGEQISSSSSTFTTTSTTYVDVTNLSVTITTVGRPVRLQLIGTSGGASLVGVTRASDTSSSGILKFVRDSTEVEEQGLSATGPTGTNGVSLPPGGFSTIDSPSAATYTYKVQAKSSAAGTTVSVTNCILVAYEL